MAARSTRTLLPHCCGDTGIPGPNISLLCHKSAQVAKPADWPAHHSAPLPPPHVEHPAAGVRHRRHQRLARQGHPADAPWQQVSAQTRARPALAALRLSVLHDASASTSRQNLRCVEEMC
eukprot:363119-Chlamydomonas_euryale.AAC.8